MEKLGTKNGMVYSRGQTKTKAVLNCFLRTDIREIRNFFRDEKKQNDMRHEFQTKMPEVNYIKI